MLKGSAELSLNRGTDACTEVGTVVPDFAFGIGKLVAHHVDATDERRAQQWRTLQRVKGQERNKSVRKLDPRGKRFPKQRPSIPET